MSVDIILQQIITKTKAKPHGNGWRGHCPAHKDKKPSFSIGQAADRRILLKCHTGCDIDPICAALGITQADLFPPNQTQAQGKPKYNIDKIYDYKDEAGNLLFQAVRKRLTDPTKWPDADKKQFRQRRPDGNGGWIWDLQGVRRVLYRLPELLAANAGATVFIPEGEKDVDRLRSLGLEATCNPMGAGKWLDEFSDSLVGRDCVILPDNDPQATNPDGTPKFHADGRPVFPGQDHAQEVAASLYGKAKSVRVLMLPNLPDKGDVSDWLNDGHTEDELSQMVEAAPKWTPAQAPTASAQDPDEWEPPAPFFEFDLPDFPLDVLPSWMRSYDESLASSTQTPVDLSAMHSITTCSASVARNVRIEARSGWEQPLNIYAVVVMASASRKSAVVEEVTHPLFDYERELIRRVREKIAEEESEYRTLAGELAELEKRAAKEADIIKRDDLKQEAKAKARELAARKKPVLPKLIADDVTSEVAATILAEQDGRIALFSAEGGIFETMAGRYTNGTPNIDVWLKGHSGDDLRVDRRDRSEHVEKPAITIGLAVQPDVLRGLIEKPGFRGRGLLGRWFYSLPPSTVGRRKIRPGAMPDEARKTYEANIKRLAAITPSTNSDGEAEPRLIRLSKDADDYLASFEEEIEPMLGPDGELASIGDWGGKLAGGALRLAGILHLAQHADKFEPGSVYLNGKWPAEVSADTLKSAIKIARYLIPQAQAAYAEMGADAKVEDAKFLLRWIEKSGKDEFTKRDAHQGTKGRFKQVSMIEPALKILEDHGYIRGVEYVPPAGKVKRRPSEKFIVNPLMSRT